MKSTVDDFWKMVVDEQVPAIVMLCTPEEERRVSIHILPVYYSRGKFHLVSTHDQQDLCYPYWGQGRGREEKFGDYIVEVVAENGKKGSLIMRELFIKVSKVRAHKGSILKTLSTLIVNTSKKESKKCRVVM